MPHSRNIMLYAPIFEQALASALSAHERGESYDVPMPTKNDAASLRLKMYAYAKRLREAGNPLGEAASNMILLVREAEDGSGRGILRICSREQDPIAQKLKASLKEAGIELEVPKLRADLITSPEGGGEAREEFHINPMASFERTMMDLGYGPAKKKAED